jgi:hypothetical protein
MLLQDLLDRHELGMSGALFRVSDSDADIACCNARTMDYMVEMRWTAYIHAFVGIIHTTANDLAIMDKNAADRCLITR